MPKRGIYLNYNGKRNTYFVPCFSNEQRQVTPQVTATEGDKGPRSMGVGTMLS